MSWSEQAWHRYIAVTVDRFQDGNARLRAPFAHAGWPAGRHSGVAALPCVTMAPSVLVTTQRTRPAPRAGGRGPLRAPFLGKDRLSPDLMETG
jgi:hypothetical protein